MLYFLSFFFKSYLIITKISYHYAQQTRESVSLIIYNYKSETNATCQNVSPSPKTTLNILLYPELILNTSDRVPII